MPFTFSHPALVLPATYLPPRYYSLTGLIIGSLTPDFEYFIRMKIQSSYGHTISGLFYFDLPLGILLAFIFHYIVRNSLFKNLPGLIQNRLSTFLDFNWNQYFLKKWFVVSISILVGAASHLLWDSFTHRSGYFVGTIPFLTARINFFGHIFPVFNILQHSSSIIGGLLLIYAFFKLPVNAKNNSLIDLKYWIIVIFITISIIAIRFVIGLDYKIIGQTIVTLISAILISLTVTPILIKK
jgi:hypothetical protein